MTDTTYGVESPDPVIGQTGHMAFGSPGPVIGQTRHDIRSPRPVRTNTTYGVRNPGPVIRQPTRHTALEVQVLSYRTDTTCGVRSSGPVIGQTRHMALEIPVLS